MALSAQSLWEDHNPYNPASILRDGTILKLIVDEPVSVEYEYENNKDESITVKLVPDQTITDFLPPADVNRSITNKTTDKVKATGRVQFRMAVSVNGNPENNTVTFSGSKLLAVEAGRSRQQIQVTGRIHVEDIQAGRMIQSEDIADLQIQIQGTPVPQDFNLPMKQEPGANPGDPAQPSANLTDAEKQQILLDYLNRILGESSDF